MTVNCRCNGCPHYRWSDKWETYFCKSRNVWLEPGPHASPCGELPPAPVMGRYDREKKRIEKLMRELG